MEKEIRNILIEIEKRRTVKDALCDSCRATGLYEGEVCSDCLGQKVMLFRDEYNALLKIGDSILDAQILN